MFVQRPDARLMSLSFGRGPRTLLALGGWIGSGEVWFELFGHLPDWRCVSMDHRGTGASRHGATRITAQAMVDDLLAVADAQQVGRCVLAAESAGAGIALAAVLQRPERFSGLVLVGASWQAPPAGAMDGFITALRQNYAGTVQAFVERCLPEPDSEDLRRWGRQILMRASPEHAVELLQYRAELALRDRLGQVCLPVLLVHGDRDVVSPPAESQTLARLLPDAELQLLPGLGHVPIMTAPALVARLIESRFVNAELRAACKAPSSP
jgi:pimeloyl-ACP methyl ester carboxylesterase